MKKLMEITVAMTIFLFTALLNEPVAAQTDQKARTIPDDVLMIAQKSCVKCHSEPGKMMALSHINLSKWDSYSAEKQASKASDMCNMVTKGKMPPKEFMKKNPDFVMTQDEIKIICDWAVSIQVAKK